MARVKHRVGIDGTAADIFSALTTSEGFAGWWSSAAEVSSVQGGHIDLTFAGLTTLKFEYQDIRPESMVEMCCIDGPGPWQDSIIRIELNQAEDQVYVTLTHENVKSEDEDFLYFTTKWTCYLLSLKSYIERGRGQPYPHDTKIHVGD